MWLVLFDGYSSGICSELASGVSAVDGIRWSPRVLCRIEKEPSDASDWLRSIVRAFALGGTSKRSAMSWAVKDFGAFGKNVVCC